MSIPSSFLMELPRDEMEVHEPTKRSANEFLEYELEEDAGWDEHAQAAHNRYEQPIVDATVPTSSAPRVMTAAEMLGESTTGRGRADPEAFVQGMLVSHPEHGLGKITALSGSGEKRSATIQFFNPSRQRRFRLVHSHLQPVKSTDA